MKSLILMISLVFSVSVFAAVPPKVTVVGKFKKMEKSIVYIQSAGGVVKVPKSSLTGKAPATGQKVTARVPVKDFLALN